MAHKKPARSGSRAAAPTNDSGVTEPNPGFEDADVADEYDGPSDEEKAAGTKKKDDAYAARVEAKFVKAYTQIGTAVKSLVESNVPVAQATEIARDLYRQCCDHCKECDK